MTELKENFFTKESPAFIFFSNPVLVGGLVIGQLAAGDVSLQTGAALALTFCCVTIPVLLFAAALGKYLPKVLRLVCYMLVSAGMLFPAYQVCTAISGTLADTVGIYMPLLAVTTIPVAYSAKFSEKHTVGVAVMDGLCLSAGFGAVAILLGAIRELFGSGSLWGIKILSNGFSAFNMPFWGFILLGFMAAGISGIKALTGYTEKAGAEEAEG